MTRIRRFSIEVIRREVNFSHTGATGAPSAARPDATAWDGDEVQESASAPAECPACASPWFVLPADSGEQPPFVQRALEKHGIHTQLSSTGELFVCSRSFELHTGATKTSNAS